MEIFCVCGRRLPRNFVSVVSRPEYMKQYFRYAYTTKSIQNECNKKRNAIASSGENKLRLSQPSFNKFSQFRHTKRNLNVFNCNVIQRSHFHSWQEMYSSVFRAVSQSVPVVTTQNFLVDVHNFTGLPWWATIGVSTFVFRAGVTAPLALYQQYIMAKVENLKLELPDIAKELQIEVAIAKKRYNWSEKRAKRIFASTMKKQWGLLIERDNCHPAKAAILVLFQLPGWIFFSVAIRNLVTMRPFHDEAAEVVYKQLQNEGLLWIQNLTVPDHTFIVPAAVCLVSLCIVELQVLSQREEQTRFKKIISNFFRCVAILTFPISIMVPSCLSFYWLTSATVGFCQNLVLMSPRVKALARVPRTHLTQSNPYRLVLQNLDARLKKFGLRKTSEV